MATSHEVLQRIWNDPEFKKKLLANPKPVLAELGIGVPAGRDVRVWENTPLEMNFVLPNKADMPPGFDPEAANAVVGRLIKKAWNDASFKSRLLADPRRAVADAVAVELPATIQVRVHEDTAGLSNLVLPVNPDAEDLSDTDLDSIAGGALSKGPAVQICGSALGSGGIVVGGGANPGLGFLGGLPGSAPVAPGSAAGPGITTGIGNSSLGPC
ncbi:MAG TPA: NHLP leader peptide family RiPP precursor [Usitatibacter sp.]|nr:NHLP leader peptide family RiPP precursor [Usitatibacter sp.]